MGMKIFKEREKIDIMGVTATVFVAAQLKVIVSQDPPDDRWHLSISHPTRYPTYDEIKKARYDLIPDQVYMAMIFPPRSEFVNVHENCFHLHEFRDMEIRRGPF